MYVYQHRCLGDEHHEPLPRGTAVALLPFPQHAGFIDYCDGQQVVLHKAKREGAVVTWPEQFDEGHIPYRVLRVPETDEQADAWLSVAYEEIERGSAWSVFDNCQDFVWHPITGEKKSPTRDAVIGAAAVAAIICAALG